MFPYHKHLQNLWIAHAYSVLSKDPSTKVGAYIVDGRNRPVANGRNGFPAGIADTDERLSNRDLKLKLTIHAEENALLHSGGHELDGCVMYVTHHPCSRCACKLIQAGIREVHYIDYGKSEFSERWKEDMKLATELFSEAGVVVSGHTWDEVCSVVDIAV